MTITSIAADPVRASATEHGSSSPLVEYFRCPEHLVEVDSEGPLSGRAGFFRYGTATCFGRLAGGGSPADRAGAANYDAARDVAVDAGRLRLPFDLAEIVTNLRQERYPQPQGGLWQALAGGSVARGLYYLARPFLGVGVRKHLQRARLRGWDRIGFPRWPLDTSVDVLLRSVLQRSLEARQTARLPFIWFWPGEAPGCVMMTHDVEGVSGLEFCRELATIDRSFGVDSAFQVVPDGPPEETAAAIRMLRGRGFEVNIHDLNHDGHLFDNRSGFLKRAAVINAHARRVQAAGFRSAAMYREQDWFDAFEFSYDMSVPNAAHLEPQRGGCCTVMPYFNGKLLELPLTTTQDYSLFHILGDYSTALWQRQTELILQHHGLASFIAHPDYLVDRRARRVYCDLLTYLTRLRRTRHVWIAPPAEVNRWWRDRQSMTLVPDGDSWRIEGPGAERARVAYAALRDGGLVYEMPARAGAAAGTRT